MISYFIIVLIGIVVCIGFNVFILKIFGKSSNSNQKFYSICFKSILLQIIFIFLNYWAGVMIASVIYFLECFPFSGSVFSYKTDEIIGYLFLAIIPTASTILTITYSKKYIVKKKYLKYIAFSLALPPIIYVIWLYDYKYPELDLHRVANPELYSIANFIIIISFLINMFIIYKLYYDKQKKNN